MTLPYHGWTITLSGNISTDNIGADAGDVDINGAVLLGADVVIDTSAGNGTVNLSSTLR